MKKRFLAALVAVAMLVGICTVVSAEDTLTPIFEENFEGENVSISNVNGAEGADEVTTDPNGTNKAWKIVGGNNSFTTNYLATELDATKEYTVVVRVLGDCGHLVVGDFNEFWQQFDAAAVESRHGVDLGWTIVSQDWAWHYAKVTGVTQISLIGQVQGDMAIMGNTLYIDDVKIYEGDKVEEVRAELEGTTPVVSEGPVDPSATAGTDATATAGTDATATATAGTTASPSVTPTQGTEDVKPPVKKSIKFKKKSVKIKKGKKATLKVTIKGAKKATFSVDKKGKKVVKLSKKKAKSVVVTGKKKGKATITAKAAGKKATCKVTVK